MSNDSLTTDEQYMREAVRQAKLGLGHTNPNPMVGAVIVKDSRVIGKGYHKKCGELHAERDAFTKLTESAEGATIYVTLEPCCHYGKQPPCTEAIVEHKIARVVIGSRDPNPLVAGKGVAYLRERGIEVIEDVLRDECDEINQVFFHYITTGKPYVVMKYAMTMDGKIATRTGASKWITGEKARLNVQKERASYAAIMAGIGTVIADDPMLNVRIDNICESGDIVIKPHQPVRVIVDSKLRIPLDSNIVKTANEYKTIVACGVCDNEKKMMLENNGIEVVELPCRNNTIAENMEMNSQDNTNKQNESAVQVDIEKLLEYLGSKNLDSVYVEGGGTIHESLMKAGLVNKASVYIAPKMFGGKDAKSPVEGDGIEKVGDAMEFVLNNVTQLDEDVWLEYSCKTR